LERDEEPKLWRRYMQLSEMTNENMETVAKKRRVMLSFLGKQSTNGKEKKKASGLPPPTEKKLKRQEKGTNPTWPPAEKSPSPEAAVGANSGKKRTLDLGGQQNLGGTWTCASAGLGKGGLKRREKKKNSILLKGHKENQKT